jgi:hypothetical protein
LENVIERLGSNDIKKTWTYYFDDENSLHQYDYLLMSPSLSQLSENSEPIIERRGVAKYKKLIEDHDFDIERFSGVAGKDTQASDHCPVFVDMEL